MSLLAKLHMRFMQFLEKRKQDGTFEACLSSIYRREEAVPVELDLGNLRRAKEPKGILPEIRDLGPDNLRQQGLEFPLRSRRVRMQLFFDRGYRSVVMVRDGVVIGDIWYQTRETAGQSPLHPHLRWFGIELGSHEVYMFDLHVLSENRGSALATWFMTRALERFRDQGFTKAYGYFAVGNLPALWMHRLIGFKEKAHVVLHRFLIFETARSKS